MPKRSPIVFSLLGAWLLTAGSVRAEVGQGRRDLVRKALEFYSVEVPSEGPRPHRFILTVIGTFADDFFREDLRPPRLTRTDEVVRLELKRKLMDQAVGWFLRQLNGERAPLRSDFERFLEADPTLRTGENTWLILSEPDDFTKIQAMIRVAKPGKVSTELPIENQFHGQLQPLPRSPLEPVARNAVTVYSFRHEGPYEIILQNAPVYRGDVVELKHYGAVPRSDVDLTALIFHLGQDLGVFSVSRYLWDGGTAGLPPGPAIVTPGAFVAGSDTPGVLALLKSCGFVTHQKLGNAVRPGSPTEVLVGTPEQFGEGLRAWHAQRRHSWQLPEIKLVPETAPPFLASLLGRESCRLILPILARFNEAADRKLHETVSRYGHPLR